MNNTTYAVVKSCNEIYSKIWNEYNGKDKNITILASELFALLPLNLITPAKVKLFKSFGKNVTELQFVQLLQYQTTGADFVNFIYLIKYYKLEFDANKMIIWTAACPYVNFKPEAINNWYIWHVLTTHVMFGKYMQNLLEFTLQNKLECCIFPTTGNLKSDLYFTNQKLVNETNEKQHNTLAQRELDAVNVALHKMHGISVISFYTTAFVDIEAIKTGVYNTLYAPDNTVVSDIVTQICNAYSIYNMETLTIVNYQAHMIVRQYFSKPSLVLQKRNVEQFKALSNSELINRDIKTAIKSYLNVINQEIHKEIKNNRYLKSYTATLLDILLSSCLNDFDFSKDYDQIIIAESLVDKMQNICTSITKTITVNKITFPQDYIKDYNNLSKTFTNYYNIGTQFILNPIDYVNLYKLKLKGINSAKRNVITFKNILGVFKTSDEAAVLDILVGSCGIDRDTDVKAIKISWSDLQAVIFQFNINPLLQACLMYQYHMADTMYEDKKIRLAANAARIICTADNYNNYFSRVHKKTTKIINYYSYASHVTTNSRLYQAPKPHVIILEDINKFDKTIMDLNIMYISRINVQARVLDLKCIFDKKNVDFNASLLDISMSTINLDSVDPDDK